MVEDYYTCKTYHQLKKKKIKWWITIGVHKEKEIGGRI